MGVHFWDFSPDGALPVTLPELEPSRDPCPARQHQCAGHGVSRLRTPQRSTAQLPAPPGSRARNRPIHGARQHENVLQRRTGSRYEFLNMALHII